MKAVNLIPADTRRERVGLNIGALGLSHAVVGVLAIIVVLTVVRVLTENTISDRKATLQALQTQVARVQGEANQLSFYTQAVAAAEQREQQVSAVAQSRFQWQRTFDQLGHVLPATTSLTSLTATTTGTAPSSSAGGSAGTAASVPVPTFALVGCANTPNQNGVATLIRRLGQLSGATSVGFQSSTRQVACGNSFNLTVVFKPLPGEAAQATPATQPSASQTTTTASTTTTTGGTR